MDVILPAALREYAKGASKVPGSGRSLDAVLEDLDRRFPGLRQRVLEDTGEIRRFVSVFVNGDHVTVADPTKVPLKDGDSVHIIPSIAGGLHGGNPER